ncbi:hypothetical protein LCM23_08770 [Cytobacillus kochii]|uniref:hypothetical protein n=1 Tax=Cytobacillus kochii TaxID=859143 RepID=UPI001CD46CE3|nr:hypothetical protein [Cytobacillus kochii]MCA1026182.1 hypothetical protein [Cytobacillus kochii]
MSKDMVFLFGAIVSMIGDWVSVSSETIKPTKGIHSLYYIYQYSFFKNLCDNQFNTVNDSLKTAKT